jgi:hypothetical protein
MEETYDSIASNDCAVRVLARLWAASCAVPPYQTSPLLAPLFIPPPGAFSGQALGEGLLAPGSGADYTLRSPDLPRHLSALI